MVLLNLRLRQNREAYDEDLRANKKVFEREQLQVANMPKTEMPPNDKVQAIAYQFNKDIENVKNALNDGLTAMNAPENIQRGFADFSKVSLAWNKLVARINPYLKGQQTAADVQPPTAGDYAFVRKTLYEGLFPFFTNAIQQVATWKDAIEETGGNPTAQNERVIREILTQVDTGFYKNVSYGTERKSRLQARLPEDVEAAAAAAANIGAAPQAPPAAAQFGVPAAQAQQPAAAAAPPAAGGAEVGIGQVNQEAMDEEINPYEEDDQLNQQQNTAREQELAGINARIMADINAYEFDGSDITQATDRQRDDAWDADTIDEVQQFFNLQTRVAAKGELREMVEQLANLRQAAGAQPAAPQPAAAAPAQQAPQQQQAAPAAAAVPARGARAASRNAALIQQVIDEDFAGIFDDYAQMPEGQRRQLSGEVRLLAEQTGLGYQRVRKYLMTGEGMTGSGFLTDLLADGAFSLAKGAYNMFKKPSGGARDLVGAAMEGFGLDARGKPLRLANSFTGNSTDPNTLADLKQRYKGKEYIGDSTGVIKPNLFNRGILGSGACCAECAAGRSCGGARCCFNARFCKGSQHYKRDKPDNWKPSKRPTAQGVKQRRREYNELVAQPAGRPNLVWKNTPVVIQEEGHKRKKRSDAGKPRNRVVGSGMSGGSNAEVEVNVKYAKLPKALQPTPEDLMPKVQRTHSAPVGGRRRRLPKESYEGYDGDANDAYAIYGNMSGLGKQEESEMLQSEMLQDKALGLLKGLPRRYGVEDPKLKNKK